MKQLTRVTCSCSSPPLQTGKPSVLLLPLLLSDCFSPHFQAGLTPRVPPAPFHLSCFIFSPRCPALTCACAFGSGACPCSPFLRFVWIWAVRGIQQAHRQVGTRLRKPWKPTSVSLITPSAKFAWQLGVIWAAACKPSLGE